MGQRKRKIRQPKALTSESLGPGLALDNCDRRRRHDLLE
jgi:hypothetical protein